MRANLRAKGLVLGAPLIVLLILLWIGGGRTPGGKSVLPKGGYYDERGHWVLPLPRDLAERLRSQVQSEPHVQQGRILDFVSQSLDKLPLRKKSEVLAALSPGCRHVWATFWVEVEVNNGGFDQYFLNTSGAYATIAAEGFRAIGGKEYSKLTLEAIAIHKNDNGRNGRNPLFNPLDDAFYDLETTKPLDLLRAKYIDAHPDEFPK